jgi:hypothetical protein
MIMQRELPSIIDFTPEAEVRSKAEHRRTEEVSRLLKLLFERWRNRLRQSKRPVFDAVQPSHWPATAGK